MGHRTLLLVANLCCRLRGLAEAAGEGRRFGSDAVGDARERRHLRAEARLVVEQGRPPHRGPEGADGDRAPPRRREGGQLRLRGARRGPGRGRGQGDLRRQEGPRHRAVVGPPWAGTDAESCIKRAFVGEFIVPFDGNLEVPYTVKLPPKAEPDPKGKKKK